MTTLNNDLFVGQVSDCRDFPSSDLKTNFDGVRANSIHLIKGETPNKLIYILNKYYPRKFQTTELSSIADVHRSTTSHHCRYLVDVGLIRQDILAGTENRKNPTYLFSLPPDIKSDINDLISSKAKVDSKISDINDEDLRIEQELRINFHPDSCNQDEKLSPQEQLSLVINTMATEIAKLQDRVFELEENAKLGNGLDISSAMQALKVSERGE